MSKIASQQLGGSLNSSLLASPVDDQDGRSRGSQTASRSGAASDIGSPNAKSPGGRSVSLSEVSDNMTQHAASSALAPNSYLSAEQRRRNEIAVHRASKISYDKSYDARGSFVHFAQHGIRNFVHEPGSARNLVNTDDWYHDERALQARKLLRSQAFALVSMASTFIALFFTDIFVLCQVPDNTALDAILTIVSVIFLTEFAGLAAVEASYPFSFFFWMDMVGTFSMIFDISYLLGPDAATPQRFSNQVLNFKSTRAARLGARAGRLTRAFKVLRLLPALTLWSERNERATHLKMANMISNKLNVVLSTRVSFFTTAVAIVLPCFAMFNYPEIDDSLSAWTRMLGASVAVCIHAAGKNVNSTEYSAARHDLHAELDRFTHFYSKLTYGPFHICYGHKVQERFHCQSKVFNVSLQSAYDAPRRGNSIWEFTTSNLQIRYNVSLPSQFEAITSIMLVCFTMCVLTFGGVVLSSSITDIALQPLERMLLIVRDRCAQIFKYTSELQEGDADEDDEDAEFNLEDNEHTSEFVLLEKAVSKLAAIAHLSTTKNEPEVTEEMNENDIMVLNMMGTQVPGSTATTRSTMLRTSFSAITEDVDHSVSEPGAMMTSITNAIPSEVMESLDEPTFNSLDIQKDVKITVSAYLLLAADGSASWVRGNVQESQLYTFVSSTESKYLPNPFHNFAHGLDVLNAAHRYLKQIMADRFLSEVSHFWLLVAAIGHDIGHIGVNNQYLMEVAHELALTYNDRSPLENMHCAKLFQVVSEPEANVFSQLDKELFKEMRKGIIDAILHTDVTKHNEMIKELSLLYQMNSEAFDSPDGALDVLQSQANMQLIINALLHCADINNPMKPWELCKRLAILCIDEFFAQGDLEKAAGIPVQMLNDRDKVNAANSQIGFIEFMIAPMVESMVRIFPQLDDLADQLGKNCQLWFDLWEETTAPSDEAKEKVNARVTKVVTRCQALIRADGMDHSEMMGRVRGSSLF